MRDILKLAVALTAFAAVACVGLAMVYQVTAPVIAGLEEKNFSEQLKSLFPDGEVDKDRDRIQNFVSEDPKVTFDAAYVVRQNGTPIGAVVTASGTSYSPGTKVLVGVGLDRKIVGVRVLANNDTPGLGAYAKDDSYIVNEAKGLSFAGQFKDKPVTDEFAVKGDVDAISASTITSKAIANMVKNAAKAASAYLETLMETEGGLK
jgi:electron transport complex protein RnfG